MILSLSTEACPVRARRVMPIALGALLGAVVLLTQPAQAADAPNGGQPAAQTPAKAEADKPAGKIETIGDAVNTKGSDVVVAKVNGGVIKKSDLAAALQFLPPQVQQMPSAAVYELLLDRIVDAKLLADAGRAEKLQDSADVKRKVTAFQDRVIQEAYLDKQIEGKVTDQALKARYEQLVKERPPEEEVRARHILVDNEADAKAVIGELEKGKSFESLAKEKSKDPSAKDGGDLGFFNRQDMVPEFSSAAFALKPGEYTKTPVQTQFGWHVIKLEERRAGTPPSFESVKDQIAGDLREQLASNVVSGLREKAKVERFGLDGKPLPVAQAEPAAKGDAAAKPAGGAPLKPAD